jgi:hypothetical protein
MQNAGSLALMEAAFFLVFSAKRDIADNNRCLVMMSIPLLLLPNVLI